MKRWCKDLADRVSRVSLKSCKINQSLVSWMAQKGGNSSLIWVTWLINCDQSWRRSSKASLFRLANSSSLNHRNNIKLLMHKFIQRKLSRVRFWFNLLKYGPYVHLLVRSGCCRLTQAVWIVQIDKGLGLQFSQVNLMVHLRSWQVRILQRISMIQTIKLSVMLITCFDRIRLTDFMNC